MRFFLSINMRCSKGYCQHRTGVKWGVSLSEFAQRRLRGRKMNLQTTARETELNKKGTFTLEEKASGSHDRGRCTSEVLLCKRGSDMLNVNPEIWIGTTGESARKTDFTLMEGTNLWCFEMSDCDLLLRTWTPEGGHPEGRTFWPCWGGRGELDSFHSPSTLCLWSI